MYTFKIKLFQTQRTTQFLPKSVLKLLRDCKSKIECLKDDRGICFCTRTPQINPDEHLRTSLLASTWQKLNRFEGLPHGEK